MRAGRCRLPLKSSIGARIFVSFVAQCLAYALPCERFVGRLAATPALLGADVVRYSFIVMGRQDSCRVNYLAN
jgi:hypothetical protein